MNIYEESLKFHAEKRGKYEIKPTCEVNNAKLGGKTDIRKIKARTEGGCFCAGGCCVLDLDGADDRQIQDLAFRVSCECGV